MAFGRYFITLPSSYESHTFLISPARSLMSDSDIRLWMEEQYFAAKRQYRPTNKHRMLPLSSIPDTFAENFLRIAISFFWGCGRQGGVRE